MNGPVERGDVAVDHFGCLACVLRAYDQILQRLHVCGTVCMSVCVRERERERERKRER